MIGIPLAWAVSNASEWWIHKHVLHDKGKKKGSFWSFHWHEHHRNCRRNGHDDPSYRQSIFGWHAQSKEALGLLGMAAIHVPLLPVAPLYTATMWWCIARYYRVHKRAHLDSAWAREHLPWHYDHHMGPNQHSNWCVTNPWFDRVMGTREPYIGTERERQDQLRHAERRARAVQRRAKKARTVAAVAEPLAG